MHQRRRKGALVLRVSGWESGIGECWDMEIMVTN